MIISYATTAQPAPVADAVDPVEPLAPTYTGLTVYLTGSDGSVWDLTNGPVRLIPPVIGFLPQNVGHRWKRSPLLPGATRSDYSLDTQTLTLPVFIAADASLDWLDLDDAFWDALSPDRECRVTVVSPNSETRVMPAWFTGPGDNAELAMDPVAAAWATYRLEFEAEDPFWQGTVSTQTFRPTTPAPYYAPAGSAYVKTLMPSDSTANSTLRNTGEQPAWVTLTASGSMSSLSVTIDGHTVSYGAIADGQKLWIDYFPARQTVGYSRGDNNETAWLGVTARDFAPVPPGAEVPIGLALTSPGVNASVSVELTPRYRRPYGRGQ